MQDNREAVALFEPLLPGASYRQWQQLTERAEQLASEAAALPPERVNLVRSLDAYYSLRIEHYFLEPADLLTDTDVDVSELSDLQVHATVHRAVQAWIDAGGVAGREYSPATISDIHSRYFGSLPHSLLRGTGDNPTAFVMPGNWRDRDVQIGRHIAISPGAVTRFLDRFHEAYTGLTGPAAIIGSIAAHQRLAWIHPFPDGNGRVARLQLHATLLPAAHADRWSLSRGLWLAEPDYRQHLDACDRPRRHDRDGRGHLSESALVAWIDWFLQQAINQVRWTAALPGDATVREVLEADDRDTARDQAP